MGIGQGFTNVNALQNCVAVSRLANGRKAVLPRLVKSVGGKPYKEAEFEDLAADPSHIAFVRAAMADVVTSGTAAGFAKLDLGPIMMAGRRAPPRLIPSSPDRGPPCIWNGKSVTTPGSWRSRRRCAQIRDERHRSAWRVGLFVGCPKAREIMRMALLKDPEIQKRIIGVNPADLVDKPLSDVPLPEDDTGAAPPPPDTLPTST